MSEPLYFAAITARPAERPVPVRRLAHQAACADHHAEASWTCEMGRDNAERVVDAIAAWLGSPEALAVAENALTLDPVHRTPAASAAAVCQAIAEHLGVNP